MDLTLQQIKDECAQEKGYKDFKDLLTSCHFSKAEEVVSSILIEVQKECLKNVSKRVNLNRFDTDRFGNSYLKGTTDGVGLECGTYYEVNKKSITNENNIIK